MIGQRVLHHLNQTLYRAVAARRIRQLKPVRHGRAQGFQIELFALYGSGGQRLLHPQIALNRVGLLQPDGAQQPQQAALLQPGLVQRRSQCRRIKAELRPRAVLPDVAGRCGRVGGGAVKRDPHTNLRSARNNWDFWTLLPEALLQVTVVMSDRGIPRSFRHMHGFGSHTYSFTNADSERFWVKFHFVSQQGIESLTDAQAQILVGHDRESHGRDLFAAIEKGDFPKWKLFIQVMPELEAETYRIHPFDLTKVWPKSDYPLIEVGQFELNRNPVNWYQDVEQSAFAPSNLVPGIGPSPDKMLQARLFAYSDAQRYRLGVNHHQIPVNAARCPVHSNHRDGAMRVDGNYGGLPHYEPNSYGQWQEQPQYREPPMKIRGDADFWNFREDDADYFSQPGALFRSYNQAQKERLFANTARALGDAPDFIKQRHIDNCSKADPAYGAGVAAALKALASQPTDPFKPAQPEADFPTATPGAEDIEL